MAKGDISIVRRPYDSIPTMTFQTAASATAIEAGEPVKLSAAGAVDVILLETLDLTIGTDTAFIGITATDSTHTAGAVGLVDVYMPLPGVVYEMAATTAANVDTAAEILALQNDRVVMTLAGGVFTLDENAGDGANNAFMIVGGDPIRSTLEFIIRMDATHLGGESV
jgi:hypothetical protein